LLGEYNKLVFRYQKLKIKEENEKTKLVECQFENLKLKTNLKQSNIKLEELRSKDIKIQELTKLNQNVEQEVKVLKDKNSDLESKLLATNKKFKHWFRK
jgi:predicted nuclease with TOPRIM domain